jgi:hypothetical protein
MSIQRTVVAAVLALVAGALAGCVSPSPEPPPPTPAEIEAMRDAWAQEWWDSLSTGTTMPDVDVIEVLPADDASARLTECLEEASVPGVTVYGPGEWSYNGALGDDATGTEAQVAWWTCAQQYPSDDLFGWMMSADQLEWLYDFFAQRHIPCLHTLGIDVVSFPSRDDFLRISQGSPSWLPFPDVMRPTPASSDWSLIASRCPLPDLLNDFGLPGYPDEP